MKSVSVLFLLLFSTNLAIAEEEDPIEVVIGEKLFLEDRFAQSFFKKNNGDYNQVVESGDPILEMLNAPGGMIQHPHRGRQMSCASCHFVDQASAFKENLVFTYNDFDTRSKIPLRNDGVKKTLRNSQNLVLTSLGDGRPLHWDGEFYSAKELSCAGLTGRNMGWLASEKEQALKNLANVIRKDNGQYPTDSDNKDSYAINFKKMGFDISKMSAEDVVDKTCELMGEYLKSLDFSRDKWGNFNGSAYDKFLELNGLRRGPKVGESSREYLQYLRDNLNYKKDWKRLEPTDLQYHQHKSQFGQKELQGMAIFFTRGQCVACHTPPSFTNDGFHRTGISQIEYDGVHGKGAFAKLKVPTWSEREKLKEKYMTATSNHLNWRGVYAQTPVKENLEFVDLGLWNVMGHPDKKSVQPLIRKSLCMSEKMPSCDDWDNDEFLKRSMGAFKTPTVRGLGQSAPYFHNGRSKDLLDVLTIYMAVHRMSMRGELVNGDPLFKAMHVMPHDFDALKAFMESLDEDYD